jgi:hypothetical protein
VWEAVGLLDLFRPNETFVHVKYELLEESVRRAKVRYLICRDDVGEGAMQYSID